MSDFNRVPGLIKMVPIDTIKPSAVNRNIHPPEQIDRFVKILKEVGWRQPVIVSNRSGFLVAGHGRLLAATRLGLKEIPVMYQDFESEDEEYIFAASDNAIAAWAELDLAGINMDIPNLGPFDIDLLGIKDFSVDMSEIKDPKEKKKKVCPACAHEF